MDPEFYNNNKSGSVIAVNIMQFCFESFKFMARQYVPHIYLLLITPVLSSSLWPIFSYHQTLYGVRV